MALALTPTPPIDLGGIQLEWEEECSGGPKTLLPLVLTTWTDFRAAADLVRNIDTRSFAEWKSQEVALP